MALFKRKDTETAQPSAPRPTMARRAYCKVCGDYRQFSRCWLRMARETTCGCCGMAFETPIALYKLTQPACPRCEEFLEQPGFEYGRCDACDSKFEIVEGLVPNLLPSQAQRNEMNKYGRSRSHDGRPHGTG